MLRIGLSSRNLKVFVRDDGVGVGDPSGRRLTAAHRQTLGWLVDLERSARLQGGCLKARSRRGAGTEIALRFRGKDAYRDGAARSPAWMFNKAARDGHA